MTETPQENLHNPSYCTNCRSIIEREENYCNVCGQKKVLPPLSIRFFVVSLLK